MKRKMRLVSTSPDNTEILCNLGMIDDLVGISRHCDYPEGLADEIPVISDFAKAEVDKIIALKPDVVFCSTYYQAGMVQELVENHIRVFVSQPDSLASIYDNIRLIGQLIDRREKAEMIVERMEAALQPQPARNLTVFCEEWGDPLVHAAPWIQEMIQLAGATPVFSDLMAFTHTKGRIVTPEQVVEASPDVVLAPWCGCHGRVPVEKITQRPGWDTIPAVRNNQVFPLEDTFFVRPGPRLIHGFYLLNTLLDGCHQDVPMRPAVGGGIPLA